MPMNILRISAAGALLAAAGIAISPYATSFVSHSATVNAPLVVIKAPFNGVIETPSNRVATSVKAGDTVLTLREAHTEGSELRAQLAQIDEINAEISALNQQTKDLETLKVDIHNRRDAQIAARISWFDHRIAEARADVARARAELNAAQERASRITALAANGNASKLTEINTVAEASVAQAGLDQALARESLLMVERDTLDKETGIDLQSNAMEESRYRLDEISVRLADIGARLMQKEHQRKATTDRIARLEAEIDIQSNFSPEISSDGVIWEASVGVGEPAAAGEPIVQVLDCSRRFLEVELAERHFENIPPGTAATVQLVGASQSFSGKVVAAYGSSARPNRAMQAANPRIATKGGLRVIVMMEAADPNDPVVARSFCDVGRNAEVHFDTPHSSLLSRARAAIADVTASFSLGSQDQASLKD